MPGGAMQANRLQVLFHTLVVLDLSGDRNGHRLAAITNNEFNRLAAWVREEGKELNTQECAVRSNFDDFINQLKIAVEFIKK